MTVANTQNPDLQTKEGKSSYLSACFWTRVEIPHAATGFISAKVLVYQDDSVTLVCPRPFHKKIFRELSLKPFVPGTSLKLAFQNDGHFELWQAEISGFLGFRDGFDEYQLKNMRLISSSSLRQNERFISEVPLRLLSNSIIKTHYLFKGCEISKNGVGLWLPINYHDRIKPGEIYQLIFTPKEVEPFSFSVQCIRPHCLDSFSVGFVAGFIFTAQGSTESISNLRLTQLIEARGRLKEPLLQKKPQHFLAHFWEGESLGNFWH